jgi:hypothetical protein
VHHAQHITVVVKRFTIVGFERYRLLVLRRCVRESFQLEEDLAVVVARLWVIGLKCQRLDDAVCRVVKTP